VIGSWKPGATGSGGPRGAYDRRDGRARDNEHGERDGEGEATTSGVAGQAVIFRVLRQGKIRRDRPAHRPRLHDHRIGDGEVACLRATHRQVEERFVGPLAGPVSRQAIGLVGRRPEAERCGGETQVGENHDLWKFSATIPVKVTAPSLDSILISSP